MKRKNENRVDFATYYYPINHDFKVKDLGMIYKDYILLLDAYAR